MYSRSMKASMVDQSSRMLEMRVYIFPLKVIIRKIFSLEIRIINIIRVKVTIVWVIFSLNTKVSKKQSILRNRFRLIITPFNVAMTEPSGIVVSGFTFTRDAFSQGSREARWYRRHPRPVVILVVPFFSQVISVGDARSFHGEKWPTTGGWRYTSPGPGPTERADGQTHNENVECPAEPDMKTSLRNGNGQSTGSGPTWPFRTGSVVPAAFSRQVSQRRFVPSVASRTPPSERNSFRGCLYRYRRVHAIGTRLEIVKIHTIHDKQIEKNSLKSGPFKCLITW